MSKFLVFDTSVIFNLGERSGGQGEKVIKHLHDEHSLLLPRAVKDEVLHDPPDDFDYAVLFKQYFAVKSAKPPDEYEEQFRAVCVDLGAGELEVLSLGLTLNAKVVIDERLARQAARQLGVDVTGTIGLLHGAVERKWIKGGFARSLVMTINQAGGRLPKIEAAKSWEEYFLRITDTTKHNHNLLPRLR